MVECHPLEQSVPPEVMATEQIGSAGISSRGPESAERIGLAQQLMEGPYTGCSSRAQAAAEPPAAACSKPGSRSRCPLRRSSAVCNGAHCSREETQPPRVQQV